MIGYEAQLNVVNELIDALDVEKQDLREMRLYDIQHVGAEEVKVKLAELGIIGAERPGISPAAPARITRPRAPEEAAPPAAGAAVAVTEEPIIVIIESTNSLLVNATAEQHAQIAMIISYVDTETLEQAIPYEIYALENQDPEMLAEVLTKLIQETIRDKEGKIERVVQRQEEQIIVVPDKNTFSIIVYASKKNQEWIRKLITILDRRRPQVLIDVTLVEVRRDEDFTYDLQLVTKIPKMPPGEAMQSGGNVTALVSPFPANRVVELQSRATADSTGIGFYADEHIQALLKLMQTKEYGRVLAKPKILVNDNEKGTINTVDRRYIAETSIVVPSEGPVQESTRFNPYDAKIALEITPHISEGDLLRLEVSMTREDFLETSTGGTEEVPAPPDQATSTVQTVVTVPNEKTIILGGLIKLNQGKGGSKIPLLGDLPIIGAAFRTIDNTQFESKLYVFVKANILRPEKQIAGLPQLEEISELNKKAFERTEGQFQKYEDFPGFKAEPMDPLKVLEEM
jgi:general secretion pathway protein D